MTHRQDIINRVLALLKKNGEMKYEDIIKSLNIKRHDLYKAIDTMTFKYIVYETDNREIGLLDYGS